MKYVNLVSNEGQITTIRRLKLSLLALALGHSLVRSWKCQLRVSFMVIK